MYPPESGHTRLAGDADVTLVRPATGTARPARARGTRRFGYREREPFDDYPDDPLSIFMETRPEGRDRRRPASIRFGDDDLLALRQPADDLGRRVADQPKLHLDLP